MYLISSFFYKYRKYLFIIGEAKGRLHQPGWMPFWAKTSPQYFLFPSEELFHKIEVYIIFDCVIRLSSIRIFWLWLLKLIVEIFKEYVSIHPILSSFFVIEL